MGSTFKEATRGTECNGYNDLFIVSEVDEVLRYALYYPEFL